MLASTVSGQSLEVIPRWHTQVVERFGGIKLSQPPVCGALLVKAEPPGPLDEPDSLGVGVGESLDHKSIVTLIVT